MKRSRKNLMQLLDLVPELSEMNAELLLTGKELWVIEEEVNSRGESLVDLNKHFCFLDDLDECIYSDALYTLRKADDFYGYLKYAKTLDFSELLEKIKYESVIDHFTPSIEYGSIFLYKGKAYDHENYKELPMWEGKLRLVEYVHPTSKNDYLFLEEDVAQKLIRENHANVVKKKKELELRREEDERVVELKKRPIAKEKSLMLRISRGLAKFPKRA